MRSSDSGLRWLHISDLHFKSSCPYDQDVVTGAFLKSIPDLIERFGTPDLVFVTGDVANTGSALEYEQATKFFDRILRDLSLSRSSLFVVPGNHDVDRTAGRALLRSPNSTASSDEYFGDIPLLHISIRQNNFLQWYNRYFLGIRHFSASSTINPIETINIRDHSVSIYSINSAAFSIDEADNGKLWVGRRCLKESFDAFPPKDDCLNIGLIHHPLSWLSQTEMPNIKAALQANIDVLLNGHLHETDAESITGVSGTLLQLSAGALYQTRDWPNRAMFASYADGAVTVCPVHYVDSPNEAWTTDTSIFPATRDFAKTIPIARVTKSNPIQTVAQESDSAAQLQPAGLVLAISQTSVSTSPVNEAKIAFEKDLFVTPEKTVLYAEPSLRNRRQELALEDADEPSQVALEDLVATKSSYVIECRPEYGGTTLCRRLAYELAVAGQASTIADARTLPNYRKKLEGSFAPAIRSPNSDTALLLDNFDLERDEKLIREITATGWFSRIIIFSIDRGLRPTKLLDLGDTKYKFEYIYLWNIHRSQVRILAKDLFQSSDQSFISGIVDKVYADLLGLCIPLTPSNVIMYLRILDREGEFHPLNRVDIVGRYLQEILRRPSDDYRDSFNSKNKLDVVSAFVNQLYIDKQSEFDDIYWHKFSSAYQSETLSEFDSSGFLSELEGCRIFVRYGRNLTLKYSFFFDYFLGRFVSRRPNRLVEFVEAEEYNIVGGVIDVITGLSSDNTLIVDALTNKLEEYIGLFSAQYVRDEFEPLKDARWPESDSDEEHLWSPIAAQIEAGPRSVAEIDTLKSSLTTEARSTVQKVSFERFIELERALFHAGRLLADALRNSDDISGTLKVRALEALLSSHLVAFQIGTIFASVIGARRYFRWGGVTFIDFHRATVDHVEGSEEAAASVVTALNWSIARTAGEELGTRKLGAVFRARAKMGGVSGFRDFANFCCILNSRTQDWEKTLGGLIERTPRTSFYLFSMLSALMTCIRNDIVSSKDLGSLKRLVAIIRAKREFKTQTPGSRAVSDMLKHLEGTSHFSAETGNGE